MLASEKETLNKEAKRLSGDLKDKKNEIGSLEKTINEISLNIDSFQESIHRKEEEELFCCKKIEALESLILEKKKRENYIRAKKEEQSKITSMTKKRLQETVDKFELIKSRETDVRSVLRSEELELDKVKSDIIRVENEIDRTVNIMKSLEQKRKEVAEFTKKQSIKLQRKNIQLVNVLEGEICNGWAGDHEF